MIKVVKMIVGSGVWNRFTIPTDDPDQVEFTSDLALLASAGVELVLASSSDWPPNTIVGLDEHGKYHLVQQ